MFRVPGYFSMLVTLLSLQVTSCMTQWRYATVIWLPSVTRGHGLTRDRTVFMQAVHEHFYNKNCPQLKALTAEANIRECCMKHIYILHRKCPLRWCSRGAFKVPPLSPSKTPCLTRKLFGLLTHHVSLHPEAHVSPRWPIADCHLRTSQEQDAETSLWDFHVDLENRIYKHACADLQAPQVLLGVALQWHTWVRNSYSLSNRLAWPWDQYYNFEHKTYFHCM